ncbi:transcription antitermination factor NusB [Solitalea canadensis DSM 3403]|uniref:Transcription antitermination factor NusB n=1 Tax=Solitalea canadensis (strain ATCC 29591 / DSM 3403 / JCM 21819 / LMG 8368 / NBRC 15130 / NCIMB 12057 / USAM 9D) TaxID=929556 RepID=H8KRB7_SOLCM|nr:transcription antitermination factor NusB [Solitalea canadensis DSM 3403]
MRIKALQTLYAFYQAETKDITGFEKSLLQNVARVNEAYLTVLNLTIEVAKYAVIDAQERASKYIPSEEDLNASTRIATNKLIQMLETFPTLIDDTKRLKIEFANDQEIVRSIFKDLIATPEYKAYCVEPEHAMAAERDILIFFAKKVLPQSVLFEQMMEDKFINWPIDKDSVMSMLLKTLKEFGESKQKLAPISANWLDDRDFMLDLFKFTIRNNGEYQDYISSKTKNWDPERIAFMDTILMKMAICELLNFKEIPVKVTINEYIDLSKEFSTPKSKVFINGILDKILVDLKAENKIIKTGRGLVE